MKFDTNIKKEEYIKFWENNQNAHFLNAYPWGLVNKNNRHQIPIYVGLRDSDNNILCETLLLKRNTPLNMCYYYAPRGFIIDWNNKKLVKKFSEELKQFLKDTNAIYLRVDPAIKYQSIDEKANPIENGDNNYELFNYLKELGYKHKGFNKLYEGNQPRYTLRTYFKDYSSFEEVEKGISKTFMRSIKRSYNYDIKIELSNSIDEFYNLVQNISSKDNFKAYTKKYYQDVFNYYSEDNYIKNYIAKINPKHIIEKYSELIKNEKNQDRIAKLNKDIEYFKDKGDKEIIIASLICIYTNRGAWSLYIGNDEIAEYTGTVNRLYYEFMRDAYNDGLEFADLFGTVGDPNTTYKNLAGLHEYKRKLGGTYLEYMGEFDLINKPFWYHVLPILLKIYRKLKK